jgi:hypothetical protein
MALYPCSFGQHRYRGKQRSVYFSLLNGAASESRKLRVCEAHFFELKADVRRVLAEVDEDSQIGMLCADCGEPKIYTLFATMYGEDGAPDAFGADFCALHGAEALGSIGWDRAARRFNDG